MCSSKPARWAVSVVVVGTAGLAQSGTALAEEQGAIEHLSAGLRYNSPSEADASTIWTASAKYDLAPNLYVRGLVGTSFKLPTAEERYAIDPFELGNPNLKPEASRNLNVQRY